jgi:tetratricopeptide (TPR) repeat protein
MGIGYTYHSELFSHFRDIRPDDKFGQIRFYERNASHLKRLSTEEQFIILCYYTNALFATENYRKHIEYSKLVLEISILEGIQFVDGHDVYLRMLENRVKSHLALKEFEEAFNIAKQLLNIAAEPGKYFALYRKVLSVRRPVWVLNAFALAVTAASLWAGLEIVRLIVFEPFYPIIDNTLDLFQSAALAIALGSVFLAWISQYYFVGSELRKYRKK